MCKQAKENMKTVRLVRHLQQVEENFPCVSISTACKLKIPEMASIVSEDFVARASYPFNEKERPIQKFQRQFYELKKQCDKSFDNLDDIEDMRKQAKKNMTRFQLEAKAEKEIGKRDAQIHVRLFSALTNMNEKTKKAEGEELKLPKAKIPEAARGAYYLQEEVKFVNLLRLDAPCS